MTPITVLLFGASGDLAQRALVPSLQTLSKKYALNVIGIANTNTTAHEVCDNTCTYIKMDFNNNDAYIHLKTLIPPEHAVLVYCATFSEYFIPITTHLVKANIIQKQSHHQNIWHRICYEKPFGTSSQNARKLYTAITAHLADEQIIFVDHFLAKEAIDNIILVRATNRIFQVLWNSENIEHIEIVANENNDIEGRGAFYDKTGALADMVQNHLIQLLALTAMETPCSLSEQNIRQEKINVMKQIEFVDGYLGQYEGYTQEHGVNPTSKTETFVYLNVRIANKQWKDTTFSIRTGKCLAQKASYIDITFKPSVDCTLSPNGQFHKNRLRFTLSPMTGFALEINAKKPHSHEILPTELTACAHKNFPDTTQDAYSNILQAIIENNRSLFVSFDEIEIAWKLIETIKGKNLPLYSYTCMTSGPKES